MNNRTATRWIRDPLLAALLLVAVGVRALIPSGFMPGPGGLIVCDGHASSRSAVPSVEPHGAGMHMSATDTSPAPVHRHGAGDQERQAGDTPCAFAVAAASLLGPFTASIVVTVGAVVHRVSRPAAVYSPGTTGIAFRFARGPPAASPTA